jgi:NADH pyrophosphatase NudC (nudix superfamily)
MRAAAQVDQLNERIRAQDWTPGIDYRQEAVGRCASCSNDSGGGKFCRHCGAPQAAAPQETKKFCTNCGNNLADAKFCSGCGWPAG